MDHDARPPLHPHPLHAAVASHRPRWRALGASIAIGGFAVVCWACTATRIATREPPRQGTGAIVRVVNNTAQPQVVYLVSGDAELYLGSVLSLEPRTFHLPPAYTGASRDYRLTARPHGQGAGIWSEYFPFGPGRVASWIIDPTQGAVVTVK